MRNNLLAALYVSSLAALAVINPLFLAHAETCHKLYILEVGLKVERKLMILLLSLNLNTCLFNNIRNLNS